MNLCTVYSSNEFNFVCVCLKEHVHFVIFFKKQQNGNEIIEQK